MSSSAATGLLGFTSAHQKVPTGQVLLLTAHSGWLGVDYIEGPDYPHGPVPLIEATPHTNDPVSLLTEEVVQQLKPRIRGLVAH
jgi:hypothetical protein